VINIIIMFDGKGISLINNEVSNIIKVFKVKVT